MIVSDFFLLRQVPISVLFLHDGMMQHSSVRISAEFRKFSEKIPRFGYCIVSKKKYIVSCFLSPSGGMETSRKQSFLNIYSRSYKQSPLKQSSSDIQTRRGIFAKCRSVVLSVWCIGGKSGKFPIKDTKLDVCRVLFFFARFCDKS